jgi:hypothetical protein
MKPNNPPSALLPDDDDCIGLIELLPAPPPPPPNTDIDVEGIANAGLAVNFPLELLLKLILLVLLLLTALLLVELSLIPNEKSNIELLVDEI